MLSLRLKKQTSTNVADATFKRWFKVSVKYWLVSVCFYMRDVSAKKLDKLSMHSLIAFFSVFFNVLQGSILSFVLSYLHMCTFRIWPFEAAIMQAKVKLNHRKL